MYRRATRASRPQRNEKLGSSTRTYRMSDTPTRLMSATRSGGAAVAVTLWLSVAAKFLPRVDGYTSVIENGAIVENGHFSATVTSPALASPTSSSSRPSQGVYTMRTDDSDGQNLGDGVDGGGDGVGHSDVNAGKVTLSPGGALRVVSLHSAASTSSIPSSSNQPPPASTSHARALVLVLGTPHPHVAHEAHRSGDGSGSSAPTTTSRQAEQTSLLMDVEVWVTAAAGKAGEAGGKGAAGSSVGTFPSDVDVDVDVVSRRPSKMIASCVLLWNGVGAGGEGGVWQVISDDDVDVDEEDRRYDDNAKPRSQCSAHTVFIGNDGDGNSGGGRTNSFNDGGGSSSSVSGSRFVRVEIALDDGDEVLQQQQQQEANHATRQELRQHDVSEVVIREASGVYPATFMARSLVLVSFEDLVELSWAWLARAARCSSELYAAMVTACGGGDVRDRFTASSSSSSSPSYSSQFPFLVTVDDLIDGSCCSAVEAYTSAGCTCALDVFASSSVFGGAMAASRDVREMGQTSNYLEVVCGMSHHQQQQYTTPINEPSSSSSFFSSDAAGEDDASHYGDDAGCVSSSAMMAAMNRVVRDEEEKTSRQQKQTITTTYTNKIAANDDDKDESNDDASSPLDPDYGGEDGGFMDGASYDEAIVMRVLRQVAEKTGATTHLAAGNGNTWNDESAAAQHKLDPTIATAFSAAGSTTGSSSSPLDYGMSREDAFFAWLRGDDDVSTDGDDGEKKSSLTSQPPPPIPSSGKAGESLMQQSVTATTATAVPQSPGRDEDASDDAPSTRDVDDTSGNSIDSMGDDGKTKVSSSSTVIKTTTSTIESESESVSMNESENEENKKRGATTYTPGSITNESSRAWVQGVEETYLSEAYQPGTGKPPRKRLKRWRAGDSIVVACSVALCVVLSCLACYFCWCRKPRAGCGGGGGGGGSTGYATGGASGGLGDGVNAEEVLVVMRRRKKQREEVAA